MAPWRGADGHQHQPRAEDLRAGAFILELKDYKARKASSEKPVCSR